MKRTILLLAFVGLFLAIFSCESSRKYVVKGVDRELARHRAQTISNVRYALDFDIPKAKTDTVFGEVAVTFDLASRTHVVLDFKNDADAVRRVRVNGMPCADYEYANEHIVIPASALSKGENTVEIEFKAGDKPLNRNDDYLYTLLVPDRARTLFPCFDQPDMKAKYALSLEVPAGWKAVSNTVERSRVSKEEREVVIFAPTEPLSTYLFSFVTGRFDKRTAQRGDRSISAYYRETDPKKLAQLDTIFNQVFYALEWLEEYTGIPYPFAKYDFIILPGFQFGGMEHTGATLYNDTRMWLGETPTLQDELDRALLIAHETAHMWFGDLVTMAWFDDVWTKEVFANYFAAQITEPMFPDANHTLNRLRTFYAPAMSEDRTAGSTPIQQYLPNLEYAGLVYNNIIYDKAPVMMMKLVELMGKDNFRKGINEYLTKYSYSNATWDNLVDILDSHTDRDLKSFSEVWVKEKGMPVVSFELKDSTLIVSQSNDRGLVWPQSFEVAVISGDKEQKVNVELYGTSVSVPLSFSPKYVVPNVDGTGYAYFSIDDASLNYLIDNWSRQSSPLTRQTMLMTIYENYLHGKADASKLVDSFVSGIANESDRLLSASLIGYLEYIATHSVDTVSLAVQDKVNTLSKTYADKSVSLQMRRMLARIMTDPELINEIYAEWEKGSSDTWNANDLTDLSYELAIRMPERSKDILTKQRSRIENPDKLREFDFVSKSCVADSNVRDRLFEELLTSEGRRNEVFARKALYYLNHFTRDEESVKYIRPALEALETVRAEGDIFFPGTWCNSLLRGHKSPSARKEVTTFLESDTAYPKLLRNKILYAAYSLMEAGKYQE